MPIQPQAADILVIRCSYIIKVNKDANVSEDTV